MPSRSACWTPAARTDSATLPDARQVMPLPLGDVQPAERVGDDLLVRGVLVPQAKIFRPDPAHEARLPQFFQPGLHAGLEPSERVGLPAQLGAKQLISLLADHPHQLIERIEEQLRAVREQLLRDFTNVDLAIGEAVHGRAGIRDAFEQTVAQLAVVPERVVGGRRHGIHRVGADQLIHVIRVGVFRVFCAGAGPEQALHFRALCLERLEAAA